MASLSNSVAFRPTSPSHRQSRISEAVQVAPYLTHVVRHHGQITLIPPENAGRIRKAKKKRPASRGDNPVELNSSLDVSLRGDSRSVSRTHSPRPGNLISSRAGSSSMVESRNSVISTSEAHSHSHFREELLIPNFPPPSFEEAIASTPSPRTSMPSSQTTSRTTPDYHRTSSEQALSQNQVSADPLERQSPLLPEENIDEDARSETSHSSLEIAHDREGHSQWEDDRKAGFSLEERVRRELERRQLAESLPHALTTYMSEEDALLLQDSESIVDTITRAYRKPKEVTPTSSGSTVTGISNDAHREKGLVDLGADNAEGCSPHTDDGSTCPIVVDTQTLLHQSIFVEGSSRDGEEKATYISSPSDSVAGSTLRGSTLSRLRDALNAPLHLRIPDENLHEHSRLTPESPALLRASDTTPPLSSSNSHRFSDSHLRPAPSSNIVSPSICSSTAICPDCLLSLCICTSKSISSQPAIPTLTSHHTPLSHSVLTFNQVDPDIPPDNRPPSSESSVIPSSTSLSARRNLNPSSPSSVRDRISAYESLTSRPLPPPPPSRPFIRRPPPPIPRARVSPPEQLGVCDNSARSSSSTAFGNSNTTTLPVRRRVPPPPPISLRHRRDIRNLNCLPDTSVVVSTPSLSTPSGESASNIVECAAEGDTHTPLDEPVASVSTATQRPPTSVPVAVGRISPPVTQSISYPEPEAFSSVDNADFIEVAPEPMHLDTPSPSAEGHVDSVTPIETREDAESVIVPNASQDELVLSASSEGTLASRDMPRQPLSQVLPGSRSMGPDSEMISLAPLQPMFTGPTDLDLLLARLDDPDFTFGGQSYDDILLLEEMIGPAARSQVSESSVKFKDVPLGKVEVLRRRVTKDGRTKLKLALLGIVVDKCGICLSQFKEGAWACLLPCQHAFHEGCLRSWMRRSGTCPMCRSSICLC